MVLPPISNVIILEPNGTLTPKLAAVGSSTSAISTDISSHISTNHFCNPCMYQVQLKQVS